MVTSRPLTVAPVAGQRGDGAHEQPPLLDLDAFVQLVHGVAGTYLDRRPGASTGPGVHAVVDEVAPVAPVTLTP
jgi:hypothetical protein